jgi:hypothetical protein
MSPFRDGQKLHHCRKCSNTVRKAMARAKHCTKHAWICAKDHKPCIQDKDQQCERCDERYDGTNCAKCDLHTID